MIDNFMNDLSAPFVMDLYRVKINAERPKGTEPAFCRHFSVCV